MPDADTLLTELTQTPVAQRDEALGYAPRGPSTAAIRAEVGPAKLRYSHEAMVDCIVANPWVHQNQLATFFGKTPAWISTVMHSDAFQALLAERRETLIDPELRATIKERFQAVLHQSLRVLQEKLSRPDVNQIPDNLALRAAELGAKSLGFGIPSAAPPPAPINPNHLNELAERLVALQSQTLNRVRTIDAQDARVVSPQDGDE
jgi:hypothetical protein